MSHLQLTVIQKQWNTQSYFHLNQKMQPHGDCSYDQHFVGFYADSLEIQKSKIVDITCVRGLSTASNGQSIEVDPLTDTIGQYAEDGLNSTREVTVPRGLLEGNVPVIPYRGITQSECLEQYDVQQSLALEDPTTGGYIAISRKSKQIVWLDKDGGPTRRADVAACDMVLDGKQLLLVVDGQSDKITVLSLQTDFQMALPVEPALRAPSRICVDEENKLLYVVHQTETWDGQEIVSLPYPRDWILTAVQSLLDSASQDNVPDVEACGLWPDITAISRQIVQCSVTATLPQFHAEI